MTSASRRTARTPSPAPAVLWARGSGGSCAWESRSRRAAACGSPGSFPAGTAPPWGGSAIWSSGHRREARPSGGPCRRTPSGGPGSGTAWAGSGRSSSPGRGRPVSRPCPSTCGSPSPGQSSSAWPGSPSGRAGSGQSLPLTGRNGPFCRENGRENEKMGYHFSGNRGRIKESNGSPGPAPRDGQEERRMRCPYCGQSESKVVDSRPADEGNSIRRRRECLQLPEALYHL